MRFILAFLFTLALLVAGCAAPPTPAPPVDLTSQEVKLPAPGFSFLWSRWRWDQQGTPPAHLEQVLAGFKSPQDIAAWLTKNTEWRDDYDTGVFLTPAEVVASKRAVCSGFARFWVYALARQGIKADFVAFWGPSSAHAVAVFRAPDGRYRLGSNQYLYGTTDLDPGNRGRQAALVAAAQEFYGSEWSETLVFSDSGVILQKLTNQSATGAPLAAPEPGRNLFSVRR